MPDPPDTSSPSPSRRVRPKKEKKLRPKDQERREAAVQRMDPLRDWIRAKLAAANVSAHRMGERLYPQDPDRFAAFLRGDRLAPPELDRLKLMVYILREERHLAGVTLIEALELGYGLKRDEFGNELTTLNFYEGNPAARTLNDHDQNLLRDIVTVMLTRKRVAEATSALEGIDDAEPVDRPS